MKMLLPFSFHLPIYCLSINRGVAKNGPSICLPKYSSEQGLGLVDELWEVGKGYQLHLSFEPGYILDDFQCD